jgi:hypothetical protein
LDTPTVFTVKAWEQDTTTELPHQTIQIAAAPATGTTFDLWYIKAVDEITSEDDVPPVPPYIADLMKQHALLSMLRHEEAPDNTIKMEYAIYQAKLNRCKQREAMDDAIMDDIAEHSRVENWRSIRYE